MKKIAVILTISVLLAGCGTSSEESQAKKVQKKELTSQEKSQNEIKEKSNEKSTEEVAQTKEVKEEQKETATTKTQTQTSTIQSKTVAPNTPTTQPKTTAPQTQPKTTTPTTPQTQPKTTAPAPTPTPTPTPVPAPVPQEPTLSSAARTVQNALPSGYNVTETKGAVIINLNGSMVATVSHNTVIIHVISSGNINAGVRGAAALGGNANDIHSAVNQALNSAGQVYVGSVSAHQVGDKIAATWNL